MDIPIVVGKPKGKPATSTGSVPMVYDTKAQDLWVYDGKWVRVTGTFG
jgi:hypothetical protein